MTKAPSALVAGDYISASRLLRSGLFLYFNGWFPCNTMCATSARKISRLCMSCTLFLVDHEDLSLETGTRFKQDKLK